MPAKKARHFVRRSISDLPLTRLAERITSKGQYIYAIAAPLAAAFAKRTFRHLSSIMAKHPRTTSIKAAPICAPHDDTDDPPLAAYTVIAGDS